MAKSTLLLGGIAALSSTTLAASNFPDCSASGPLGNNSVCDTSLGEILNPRNNNINVIIQSDRPFKTP